MRYYAIGMLLIFMASVVGADDWPQWRGPGRDGVWRGGGIIERFPEGGLKPRWQVPIGPGYSGPIVAQGRVFLTDRQTEPDAVERVWCFDAESGQELWKHVYPCVYKKVGYPAGPRASVLVEGPFAYTLGAMGDLFCLQADKGEVVWHLDLKDKYGIKIPTWGVSAAPLIYEDLLVVQAGAPDGCILALDKVTGKERWRAVEDKASYIAPLLIEQAGKDVLVCRTGSAVWGLEPQTGKVHWEVPFKPERMVIGIADMVQWQGFLFASSFFDGSLLIKLSKTELKAEKVWHRVGKNERNTDALHCCISTPVILDGYVYGVDSYGELRCLQLATGDRVWESQAPMPKARWANIHMVRRGDKIWMFTERGDLIISRLSPTGYEEISRTHLIDPTTEQLKQRGGVCWSHPAFAEGHVFVRNDKELRCFDLRKR